MAQPPRLDKPKLAKVMALLGSPNDGEALAAARVAARMLTEAGLTWADLLAAPAPPSTGRPDRADYVDMDTPTGAQAAIMLRFLHMLAQAGQLPPATVAFVGSLGRDWRHRRRLTRRQFDALARVYRQYAGATY